VLPRAAGVLKYKRMAEQELEKSGLPYTIVRPNRLTDGGWGVGRGVARQRMMLVGVAGLKLAPVGLLMALPDPAQYGPMRRHTVLRSGTRIPSNLAPWPWE
jgi:hypothetical protein